MNRTIILVLLLLAAAFAAEIEFEKGSWLLATNIFGSGPDEITPELNYNGDLRLTLDSTAKSRAFFKMITVFNTPTNLSYDIEFEARVNAPGIDLDYSKDFGSGEQEDNDGPNLFAFAYGFENATLEDPPISITSLSFYDRKKSLCHWHMECNWMGDPDSAYGFYCSSETTASGWVYDAKTFGTAVKVNEVGAEAFQDNDWKMIRLNMDAGECGGKNTTLMIMGVDPFADYPYTWEFKDFRLVTTETIEMPLDYIYVLEDGEYSRLPKPIYCGDGAKEGTEECDGDDGVEPGWTCTSSCKLESICGDNKIVGDEVCDGSARTPGFSCSSDCKTETPICGDNLIVADEVCDGTETLPGFACAADCKSMSAVCGDGVVVGAEECDGVNGTDAQHGCTQQCTLYRLLTEDEQEAVDAFVSLIESTDPGLPATAKLNIPKGLYTSRDIKDQFILAGNPLDANVSFCAVGVTACEARYIFVEDAMATATQFEPVDVMKGVAKVYETDDNGTTHYYIGFKGGVGWMPYIEMDTTMWIIVGLLVFLVLGAGVVLLLILGGFAYISKRGGFQFRRIFK
ncbi:MAG: hypothetical protein KAW41_05570 [Candidatus Diapherotrites archaeon]|nr:hypothetical protein [Candidatus Diapherotrites archaeon]